jgi:antirestriction protein
MTTYMTIDDVRGEAHIDSRDLIELRDAMREMLAAEDDALDADERAELARDIAAIDEIEGAGLENWQHGAQFIADHAFEDYARELAEDIGAIDAAHGWPLSYIDWEAAADALKMDYTAVDFLGTTYYAR